LIQMLQVVFRAVGFSIYTSCFVLLDSNDSRCVLCRWIHIIHVVFCVTGLSCFTLCFVLLDS
jgi:hypothetical protein